MVVSIKESMEFRDRLHNLDITNLEHMKHYRLWRRKFIEGNEGSKSYAYDDANGERVKDISKVRGNVTVGIGFNMSRSQSREEWGEIFRDLNFFDLVKLGEKKLNEQQITELFEQSLKNREDELIKIYGIYWYMLRLNERLVIEDAYFNNPKLVGKNTRFYQNIISYLKTGNINCLKDAVFEIKFYSNPTNNKGIQNRRDVQAELLSSIKCPLYSAPYKPCLPSYPGTITVKLGETILPRGTDKWPSFLGTGSYIWRTVSDSKVRDSHASLEGMVFSEKNPPIVGHPGKQYNCRCYKEPLPIYVRLIEETKCDMDRKLDRIGFQLLIDQAKEITRETV